MVKGKGGGKLSCAAAAPTLVQSRTITTHVAPSNRLVAAVGTSPVLAGDSVCATASARRVL